jgi:FkbM family methyltransferase
VGQFLLPLVAIDDSVSYVGIEANPHCCTYLEWLLRENQLEGHQIVPVGFGSRSESRTLRFEEEGDPSASFVEEFRPPGFFHRARTVTVRRGDELLGELELDSVALVKIDVEGAELDVLAGLRETLEQQRPAVIFEVLGSEPIRDGRIFPEVDAVERRRLADFREARARAVEVIFAELDYRLYRIGLDGSTARVAAIELDEPEMDYLGWPSEAPMP